jgi:hypothetical protein
MTPAILSHQRGVGHRRERGAGRGGRVSTQDERAAAYGEVVRVRRPGAGVDQWWQESRSPGRPRISRKAIAHEKYRRKRPVQCNVAVVWCAGRMSMN